MEKKYVLYFHRNIINKEIFYVGIGSIKRAVNFAKSDRSAIWYQYIQEHGKPIVEIYKIGLNKVEALYLESYFIKMFGRKDLHAWGTLLNLTNGGEGLSGRKLSEEEREKRKGINNPNYGRRWTIEMKEAARQRGRRQICTPETRANLSRAGIGRIQTGEAKEKVRQAKLGIPRTEETKRKVSESLKGRCLPEYIKEKQRLSHLGSKNHFYGRKHSEETKRKISEKQKIRLQNKKILNE